MYEVTKIDNATREREIQVVDRLVGPFLRAWNHAGKKRVLVVRPTILFTYVVERIS